MYSFENDYSEGGHPSVIKELLISNEEQSVGYGLDEYSQKAAECIREKLASKEAEIHMLMGGTQTNIIAITSFLRPFEAVIAADTGHIAVHETGAIEATGHKVVTIPVVDGKLTPSLIETVLEEHTDEHMVKPKMVYVSNTTEVGTHYTKEELKALYRYCQKKNLYFYIDGARLASALSVPHNTMFLCDYKECCDAFYIGGTKCGALFGEALVVFREELKDNLRYVIKQRGGLLAKGRLLGIQFEALFRDSLYLEIGQHENEMAQKLGNGIRALGYSFLYDSVSNQLFPIFPDDVIEQLKREFLFGINRKISETHHSIRLVTSWATSEEAVDHFLLVLSEITNKEV